ncbi:MAG: autotransporter-associated beta strand repeat-containing protein [Limisphaerales bacterium]
MSVGDVQFSGGWNDDYLVNYSTIIGAGKLKVTDPNSLISVGEFEQATLDLAGLSNFTANVSQLWLGVSPDPGAPDYYGPVGWLLLGRTNIITTTPNQSVPGILIGAMITSYGYYNGNNYLALGGTNRFNTDGLVVGGYRNGYNASYLMFGNQNASNTFTLRGSDGTHAASVFSIGDMTANWGGFNTIPQDADDTSSGVADFSGGVVDILADKLYIGSSGLASTSSYTSGNGTLIAERGTITATNVYLGRKVISANDSSASGTLILRSNVVMNVMKDFSLYNRTNGDFYSGTSLLMVSNTAVLNIGGNLIWTNSYAYDPAANVIALGGGTIKMTGGGRVTTPNLLGFGSISNASSIIVTNSLSMNGDTLAGIGTFNLSSNLNIGPAVNLNFAIGASSSPSVSDHLNVRGNVTFNNNPVTLLFTVAPAAGSYHLIDYTGTGTGTLAFPTTGLPRGGTLTFHQPSAGWAGFTATASTPATLKWAGIAGSSDIWSATNLSSAFKNWTNTTTLTPDYFYQLDGVTFGNAAGVATEVMLDGTLVPATITVTGNSSYTFSGSGKISGAPVFNINQNSASTFTFGATGGSDLITPINVNSGTLKFTDPSAMSQDGNGGVNVASGAAFDLNGSSYPYYMGQITISGSGLSGSGALYTSSGNVNSLRNLNLSANATIGLGNLSYNIDMASSDDSTIVNALNLNGHTLSLTGTNAFMLQFANVGNGSINVAPGGNLYVYNCNLTGSGTVNFPANSTLSLWDRNGYLMSTMGAINKSLVVSNAVFQNNNLQSYQPSSIPDYFGGTVTLNGALTLIPTYQPMLFSGVLQGSGSLALKGPNTVTMTASNTYTGPTVLSQGTLLLSSSGALASTNIVVNPAATFNVTGLAGGYKTSPGQSLQVDGAALGNVTVRTNSTVRGGGSISGSVTLSPGGTLAAGSTSLGGTLAVGGNLTISGGTNVFKWGGPDDLVSVGGNLSITAPVVIKVNPVDLLNGRHVLYQYAGTKSGVTAGNFIFQSTRPLTFVLDTSVAGQVAVVISGSQVLSWRGGTASAPTAWDETHTNWLKAGSPDHFLGGDSVQFDNTSLTNRVSIAATIDAGAVIFSNTAKSYVFTGAGGITAGSMKTIGGSSVTFSNTGDVTMTGSGLSLTAGTLTFAQPADTTLTAKIKGGGLAKSGTNTLTLVGPDSSSFTGAFNVNGGTVQLGTADVLGASATTIASGATLDVNGLFSTNATIYTSGAGVDGNGAINNNSEDQVSALANISFNGDTTFGASGARWDVIPGTTGFQGNNKKLTKLTANEIWIRTGSDTGLGDIDVQEGRLVFAEPGTLLGNTSSNIVVRTNATLAFANGIQDFGGKHTRLDPVPALSPLAAVINSTGTSY